ncbi:MAG TPA: FAD-binding oxidoreductase, partial [Candidatus Polarisedimenticolaceae bacterium]|nr:FAD-binding oxidoreductase [Candidatus Polarisedimenticolaceae bacterium]
MIRSRPLPAVAVPPVTRDPEVVAAYLDDASGAPRGHACGLVRVESEGEAAALLAATRAQATPILCQAARTSLTGGAIPYGELVVSVERMDSIGPVEATGDSATVRVEPGVRLATLGSELARRGWYYPPTPTYRQAMIGGSVATNAGGAATFKYGVTRQWVRALRVLLWNGELIEVERGQLQAARGGRFTVVSAD